MHIKSSNKTAGKAVKQKGISCLKFDKPACVYSIEVHIQIEESATYEVTDTRTKCGKSKINTWNRLFSKKIWSKEFSNLSLSRNHVRNLIKQTITLVAVRSFVILES